jgi:hypothetical protein
MKNDLNGLKPGGQQEIADSIAYHAAGGPRSIDRRLTELRHEWDVDRLLMAGGAVMGLVGLVARRPLRTWLWLPAISFAWMLQQALVGTSPLTRRLRSQGLRGSREIQAERLALKALRGDFRRIPPITEGRDPSAVGHILDLINR